MRLERRVIVLYGFQESCQHQSKGGVDVPCAAKQTMSEGPRNEEHDESDEKCLDQSAFPWPTGGLSAQLSRHTSIQFHESIGEAEEAKRPHQPQLGQHLDIETVKFDVASMQQIRILRS